MKSIKILLTSISLLIAVCVNAQESKDFFVGTWKFEITGTPQGDAVLYVVIQRGEDGKLQGEIKGEGQPSIKTTRMEEKKDKSFTAYYPAGGYNCYLYAEKIDENHIEGSLMDMFDATGERVKTVDKDKK